MTDREAQAIIALFCTAYESQQRTPAFMRLLASELVTSGVSFEVMKGRALTWIRENRYWPAVSDMVFAEPAPVTATKLLPPPNPIPASVGLEILKGAAVLMHSSDLAPGRAVLITNIGDSNADQPMPEM